MPAPRPDPPPSSPCSCSDGGVADLAGMTLLYIASFLLMLVFSISLVDFHTPADTRVLSPVFAVWVVLAACVLSAAMRRLPPARASVVAVASFVVAACVFAWPTTKLVARLWREGD